MNHGPTTSIYYRDPDDNKIETQVNNFDTIKDADDFMKGRLFSENPIDTDFDPNDLVKRLKAGESDTILKERFKIGPRSMPVLE